MNTGQYAIFIEPEGSLREQILSCKMQVEAILGEQPYCLHPPHCTLWTGSLLKPNEDKLLQLARRFKPFVIETCGMVVFRHDAATAGGHTIAFRVTGSKALWQLQSAIAEELIPYLPDTPVPTPAWCTSPELLHSMQRFGFAFVGAHWIPHFSIASLQVDENHDLFRHLANLKHKYCQMAECFSLWLIDGQKHVKLREFCMGGDQCSGSA